MSTDDLWAEFERWNDLAERAGARHQWEASAAAHTNRMHYFELWALASGFGKDQPDVSGYAG